MTRINFDNLQSFVRGVFDAVGLDDFSAAAVSDGLCETSLRGVDSHGVRLLPHYARSAQTGRKNPSPDFRFERTFPVIGVLDADNAFGHAAGMRAIDLAIDMAAEFGMGAIAVHNSSHPGAMASFALKAARQGYMAFAFTHADSLLLSAGGKRPYFGTNPICFAVPRQEEEPYCLDMATSVIPWNRLRIHRDSGEPLPPDVAADGEGMMTTDADIARCLLPVGGAVGGYKGFGLASMVEILCGVYTGVPFGRAIPAMFEAPMDKGRDLGQFYLVMRCDAAQSTDTFRERMQKMSEEVRNEPATDEPVMLPGDRELTVARERRITGVPLDDATADAFRGLASEHGVELVISD